VDDIFGTRYFDSAGGDISYPWETEHENHHKHETYKWYVRRDQPANNNPYTAGYIRAFRVQAHSDLFNLSSVRHSFAVEAQVCLKTVPNRCGIIRFGGQQHLGDLFIDAGRDRIPVIDTDAPPRGGPQRLHYDQAGSRASATWYGRSEGGSPMNLRRSLGGFAHETSDMWGYYPKPRVLPVRDLTVERDFVFFDDPALNGSFRAPHILQLQVPRQLRPILDANRDGVANFLGYTDRYGAVVEGMTETGFFGPGACDGVSLDCVPVSLESVPIPPDGAFQHRGEHREYDIYFGRRPSGWIEFPN
jgi:hypothetical protein